MIYYISSVLKNGYISHFLSAKERLQSVISMYIVTLVAKSRICHMRKWKIRLYNTSMTIPSCLLTLSARGRLYTSESDVCRRQILTYKDAPAALKELKY